MGREMEELIVEQQELKHFYQQEQMINKMLDNNTIAKLTNEITLLQQNLTMSNQKQTQLLENESKNNTIVESLRIEIKKLQSQIILGKEEQEKENRKGLIMQLQQQSKKWKLERESIDDS